MKTNLSITGPRGCLLFSLFVAFLIMHLCDGYGFAAEESQKMVEIIDSSGVRATIPLAKWLDTGVEWIADSFSWLFDPFSEALQSVTKSLEKVLLIPPIFRFNLGFLTLTIPSLAIVISFLIGFFIKQSLGIFSFLGLFIIFNLGLWEATISTISLTVISAFISVIIGFPIGLIAGKSDLVETILAPILDFMQTMPPFVYLIPAVLFFGLGRTPGIVATVIFACVPGIKLTSLGIRQIQPDLIEAGRAFGCNTLQLLFKVELPNAMPSIMVGINQVINMSLGMVIITALIGAGGLGAKIISGIQRMYVGKGLIAGLAVVLVAILLDRITQNLRKEKS